MVYLPYFPIDLNVLEDISGSISVFQNDLYIRQLKMWRQVPGSETQYLVSNKGFLLEDCWKLPKIHVRVLL